MMFLTDLEKLKNWYIFLFFPRAPFNSSSPMFTHPLWCDLHLVSDSHVQVAIDPLCCRTFWPLIVVSPRGDPRSTPPLPASSFPPHPKHSLHRPRLATKAVSVVAPSDSRWRSLPLISPFHDDSPYFAPSSLYQIGIIGCQIHLLSFSLFIIAYKWRNLETFIVIVYIIFIMVKMCSLDPYLDVILG